MRRAVTFGCPLSGQPHDCKFDQGVSRRERFRLLEDVIIDILVHGCELCGVPGYGSYQRAMQAIMNNDLPQRPYEVDSITITDDDITVRFRPARWPLLRSWVHSRAEALTRFCTEQDKQVPACNARQSLVPAFAVRFFSLSACLSCSSSG